MDLLDQMDQVEEHLTQQPGHAAELCFPFETGSFKGNSLDSSNSKQAYIASKIQKGLPVVVTLLSW